MTKEKVRVQLEVWGRSVMFRVLEMDERFRAKENEGCHPLYVCGNKILIKSISMPGLYCDEIYLRGYYRGHDKDGQCQTCATVEAAKVYKQKILDALQDWAKNWPGWGEDDEQPEVDSHQGEIYSF